VPLKLVLDKAIADTIRTRWGSYTLTWHVRPGGLAGDFTSSIVYTVVEGGQAIRVQYTATESGQPVDELVRVVRRNLTYGARLFWVCPVCNRRAAILYYWGSRGMPGGVPQQPGRFRCRHCHGLTYRSSQESDGRISELARLLERHPGGALAALDRLVASGNLVVALLVLKALVKVEQRQRRELRKGGYKVP
jgi:hypothetical protein